MEQLYMGKYSSSPKDYEALGLPRIINTKVPLTYGKLNPSSTTHTEFATEFPHRTIGRLVINLAFEENIEADAYSIGEVVIDTKREESKKGKGIQFGPEEPYYIAAIQFYKKVESKSSN